MFHTNVYLIQSPFQTYLSLVGGPYNRQVGYPKVIPVLPQAQDHRKIEYLSVKTKKLQIAAITKIIHIFYEQFGL